MDKNGRISGLERLLYKCEKNIQEANEELRTLQRKMENLQIEIEFEVDNKTRLREELRSLGVNLSKVDTEIAEKIRERRHFSLVWERAKEKIDTSIQKPIPSGSRVIEHNSEVKQAQLSRDNTLEILRKVDNPNGVPIKDILREYLTLGISTHARIIDQHVRQLIEKGAVFQTNPNNLRGRKFRVIKKES